MDLLNNTVYLLFLTLLLILTLYPNTWVKIGFLSISILYAWFLWSTGQILFLFSILFIGLFLLYSLLKTVFHLF